MTKKEIKDMEKKPLTPWQNFIAALIFVLMSAISVGVFVAILAVIYRAIRWGFGI